MGEFTVVQNPTCVTPGYETSACERCTKTKTRILDALGHNWGEWALIQKQSCINEEIQEHTCLTCNLIESKTTAEPTGHKYEEWNITQTMTCTDDEIKTRICSVCQHQEHFNKSAPGHQYTAFE